MVFGSRQLLDAALQLSAEEQAALAGELIQSLDTQVDADAEAAWSAKIHARLARVDAGLATTIPWSELVAGSTRLPDVILELEFLDEAIEEAEAAARWYAGRSSAAAQGFADEVDAAIAAIEQNPEAWPMYDYGTRHYLLQQVG